MRALLILVGAVLGLLTATRLATGLQAVGEAPQLDYAEPIIYAQAARVPAGQALYQPLDRAPYTVAAYTPLYYKVASELQVRVGPGFGPGRAVSFASGLAAAAGVFCLAAQQARAVHARRLVAALWTGLLAAMIFLGLGFPGGVPWFALYRVDVLAEALSLAAIVVLASGRSYRQVLLAGVFAGSSFLTKQSFIAALLAGTLWLWVVGERRKSLVYCGSAVLCAASVCFSLERSTGAFVANVIWGNANPLNFAQVSGFVTLLAQTLGAPLAICAVFLIYARPRRMAPTTRLVVMYWVASALPLVGLLKFGASYNYWIELAAPTAVLASVGLAEIARWASRARFLLIGAFAADLVLASAPVVATAAADLSDGFGLAAVPPTTDRQFDELVHLVRSQGGTVLADPLDEVVLGGRPVYLEPVVFSLFEHHGGFDLDPVVERICAGEVTLLVLGAPIDAVARSAPNGEPWWPPKVMHALEQRMQPAGQLAGRFLYVPGPERPSADCRGQERGRTSRVP